MSSTPFRKRKLDLMFSVFDLDEDGIVRREDFVRRVEAVAQLRGWDEETPEYDRNLRFALEEWDNLRESADADEDGEVTREEFLSYARVFLADRESVRAYARGDVQLLFDAMDTDGDGKVSADEYREYLIVCGADPTAADAFFAHADLDEDRRISRAEMARAMEEFLLGDDPEAAGGYLFGAH